MKKIHKIPCCISCFLLLFLFLIGCGKSSDNTISNTETYGVFLNYEGNLTELSKYETVVIDAQYINEKDIAEFKAQGHTVYSYINVGSIENFRDYYHLYEHIMLGEYEHWEEERWIDVSSGEWQEFILNKLSAELLEKGIDGFFVDNCDVYYEYPNIDIFNGLTIIMEGLRATGKDVVINGGDTFLEAYCSNGGKWTDIITGINQETVFSSINWENHSFGRANKEEHEYFMGYIETYGEQGADIFLLEYTTDEKLIWEINKYCKEKDFQYYISSGIELGME